MSGKLFYYLEKIDSRAKNEFDRLIPLLAEQQGRYRAIKGWKSTQMGGFDEQYQGTNRRIYIYEYGL